MKTVLFVCAGNAFRSLTAELALKQALGPVSGIEVTSAGTHARTKPIRADVAAALAEHNLDPAGHKPRELTHEILSQASLIIVMGSENKDWLRTQFNYDAVYFNTIAHGREEPVIDLIDAVPNYRTNREAASTYVKSTVDYIVSSVPGLAAALPRYLTPKLSPAGIERTRDRPIEP